ncbi:MAG: hypothetical protein M3Z23_15530 [Acidobacteriota bacterium]|nr:hypothetical protein [Acidobacteriota bacterium]
MTALVTQRPRARLDLLEQFVYSENTAVSSSPSGTLPPWRRHAPASPPNRTAGLDTIPVFLALRVCDALPSVVFPST